MSEQLHNHPANQRAKRLRLRGAAVVALCGFLWSLLGFQARCAGIRGEVLRLHVIANSGGEADQAAKLAVRDALLAAGADIFGGSASAAEAEAALAPRLDTLTDLACKVLRARGMAYDAAVVVDEAYFNTRSYEGITLPAGRYRAVRVILGEGGGENWWCVMFPPLCLPAAERRPSAASLDAVLTDGELRLVKSSPKLEIRFKIVELWESLKERLRGGRSPSVVCATSPPRVR